MQSKRLDDIRKSYTGLLDAQGKFSVQGMKVASATQTMTEALNRQKLTIKQAVTNATVLKNIYKEQLALQNAAVISWKRDGFGAITADFIVPRELPRTVDTLGRRLAFMNTVLASNAQQMITWGKNTQWAGRQLMVGFTVPFGIVAGAAAKMAMQVDAELVRVQKVYDTVAKDAAGQEAELAKVRSDSYAMAANAANLYGASIQDTLKTEAGLAATGVRGADLINQTNQIVRLATLGEIEYQQALEMTIALQNAFGLSTDEITKKMNFMNAVENNTSLSIQNIAEAIPRAAASMAGLGVSVEEMIVLLVAMREKGVDAAEGANALKSAATRLLRPTPRAQEIFRETFGVDVMEIATRNAGNLFDILKELSTVMDRGTTVEKAQALSALFGTYQFNRLNAALSGITDAMNGTADQSSQTARAMEQMFVGASEHAATADEELQRWQQSASGQIKRAVQNFKVQLAELGQTFLPIVAMLLNAGNSLLKWFNDLPSAVKNFVVIGAAIAAIAGPLVMIIGLTANLFGNLIKFGTFLAGFFLKFSIVNQQQQAAAMLAKVASVRFSEEARSAQLLSSELGVLNQQLAQNASLQSQIAGISTGGGRHSAGYKARHAAPQAGAAPVAAGAAGAAAATEKASRNMFNLVKYSGMAAIGMSLLTQNTNEFVGHLQTAAIALMVLGPLFGGVFKKGFESIKFMLVGLSSRFASVGGAISTRVGGAVASVGTGVKAVGGFLSAWAGPIGMAALAAGALFLKVNTELKKAREEQEKLNNSAEDWAEVLGYVKLEYGQTQNEQGEIENSVKNVQKAMMDQNKSLVKAIHATRTEQEALNIAIMEGIKVAQTGGSAEQARQAVEAVLGMKFTDLETKELMLKVDLDFSKADAAFERQVQLYGDQFQKIMNNQFDQSGWESFAQMFTGNELNERARTAAKGMGEAFYNELVLLGDQEQSKIYTQFQNTIAAQQNTFFDRLSRQHANVFKEAGVTTFQELQKLGEMVTSNYALAVARFGEDAVNAYLDNVQGIEAQMQAERELVQAMLRTKGVAEEVVQVTYTLAQARRVLGVVMDVAEAERMYQQELSRTIMNNARVTEADQLRILNIFRLRAGLQEATSVEQGFKDSLGNTAGALDENTDALEDNEQAMQQWADSVVDATKGAFSGARDFALSVADDYLRQHHDGIIEGIRNAGEARDDALDRASEAAEARFDARREASEARYEASVKAFDARWERLMDSHTQKWERRNEATQRASDRRIAAIDAQIERERKLEETRERIFRAEETRIKRLAQMFSMNVDLNMALNSGDLDEAAKVMANAQAQQEQYAMEDAGITEGDATKRRIEALQKQRDAEQEALKKRLADIKKLEQEEKKSLDKKKKLEQEALKNTRDMQMKALDAERKRYQKATQEARRANQQQTADAVKAEQRRLDSKRRSLELELLAIRASTPRNKKEYNEQIRQIEEIYGRYGVRLKAKGDGWTKTIGNGLTSHIGASAKKLQNDINWKKYAEKIAEKITQGAFGMTVKDFLKWIETGEFPFKKGGTRSNPGAKWGAGATPYATGGYVDGPGTGTSDSIPARLSNGEFVMRAAAVKKIGVSKLNAMNTGTPMDFGNSNKSIPKNIGGPGLGFSGIIAGMIAGMMKTALSGLILRAGFKEMMMMSPFAAGREGKYGDHYFTSEQLGNAAIIASVGRQLGASNRDLIIALMTAMQESNLRNINYGDRDSIGLFQQRNAWGTREQRLNPYESARMFFEGGHKGQRGLFAFKNRDKMSLTQAAQAVQVSAFPNAYAKWENEARDILERGLVPFMMGAPGGGMGPGGMIKPVNGRVTSRYGMRKHPITGQYKLHDGTDIAAPLGTTIKAAQAGRVLRASYAGGYGNWTVIDHGGGLTTGYGHQAKMFVGPRSTVGRGQPIGTIGMTGNTTGPHVHFMTGMNGKWVNPGSFIPGLRDGGVVKYDNTLANLHKKETVLTAPLSSSLERGIRNLESGGNIEYNVGDINIYEPANDLDVEKAVNKALLKAEKKRGPNRKVGSN